MEYYDIAVYAAISGWLSVLFEQHGVRHGSAMVWGIFALRFLIRPLGGILIARYAEKKGRKAALIVTSSLTGVATFAMAFMPVNFAGHAVVFAFLLLQMLQAFSFGGEYPTVINYLLRDARQNESARISALIVGSSLVGVVASLSIVLVLNMVLSDSQMLEYGWRIPLLIGGLNVVICFWFRTRLPFQAPEARAKRRRSLLNKHVLLIFMLTITGSVVFYVQNMASTLIGNALLIGELKAFYPIINSLLLMLMLAAVAIWVDKFSDPQKAYNRGVVSLLLLAIPLYWLMDSQSWLVMALAALVLSFISALILANLAAVLWQTAGDRDVALGLGYNLASSIFGGLTPAIINAVIPYGFVYAGLYVALSALPLFLAYRFHAKWNEDGETLAANK
ncbi:MFS transporter [Pantoea sp. B65]